MILIVMMVRLCAMFVVVSVMICVLRGWCIRLRQTPQYLVNDACCICTRKKQEHILLLDLYLYTLPNDEHVWAHRPCAEWAGLKKFSKK
jgi:hypothetical protein